MPLHGLLPVALQAMPFTMGPLTLTSHFTDTLYGPPKAGGVKTPGAVDQTPPLKVIGYSSPAITAQT